MPDVVLLQDVDCSDVGDVGGKNVSICEMVSKLAGQGIALPGGFATTADADWAFVDKIQLRPAI